MNVERVIFIEIHVAIITGLFTLFGVIITGIFSLLLFWLTERQKRKKESMELYKDLIKILNKILFATFVPDFDGYCNGIEQIDNMFVDLSVFASEKIWNAVIEFMDEARKVTSLPAQTSQMNKTQRMRASRKKLNEILRLIRCEVGAGKMK